MARRTTRPVLTAEQHAEADRIRQALLEASDDDLREIESATAGITVQGARYSEGAQRLINR